MPKSPAKAAPAARIADADEAVRDLLTLRDFVRWGVSSLRRADAHLGHGCDDPWDESLALVLHALALDPDTDPRALDARLTTTERSQVVDLLKRRIEERIPAAYLTGTAHFAGLSFRVDERVLIPRSPIAELIDNRFEPWLEPDRVSRVLELCTGSACIAIACCSAFPDAEIVATDISADALAVARINREEHGCEEQLALLKADLYDGVEGRFDLLIANPPYVDAHDMATLPAEYRHEPRLALAAGDDGLDLVVRILADAGRFLTDNALLVVEVGNSDEALLALFPDVPFTWPEFERGEGGIFVLDAAEVRRATPQFRAEAQRRG